MPFLEWSRQPAPRILHQYGAVSVMRSHASQGQGALCGRYTHGPDAFQKNGTASARPYGRAGAWAARLPEPGCGILPPFVRHPIQPGFSCRPPAPPYGLRGRCRLPGSLAVVAGAPILSSRGPSCRHQAAIRTTRSRPRRPWKNAPARPARAREVARPHTQIHARLAAWSSDTRRIRPLPQSWRRATPSESRLRARQILPAPTRIRWSRPRRPAHIA